MRKPLDQPLTSWPTRQVKKKNPIFTDETDLLQRARWDLPTA